MTRHTASGITDDDLDSLYAEFDRLAAENATLRAWFTAEAPEGPRGGLYARESVQTLANDARGVRDTSEASEGRTEASDPELRQQIADAVHVATHEWAKKMFQPRPGTVYDLAAEHVLPVVEAHTAQTAATLARVRAYADRLDAMGNGTDINAQSIRHAAARGIRRHLDNPEEFTP